MFYDFNGETYDFSITTQKELNNIIKYFYSNDCKKVSIEFEILYNTGSSIKDELNLALNVSNITEKIYYLLNDKTIILTK